MFNSIYSRLGLVLLCLTVVLLYMPMLGHEPLVDDPMQIALVQNYDSVWESFQLDSSGWFRPVKSLIFYLTVDGESVWKTKLTCLVLFLVSIFCVYQFLCLYFKDKKVALLGAFFYALHPTTVATVQFMSAVNNQVSFICYVSFLALCIRYLERSEDTKSDGYAFAGALLFLCGALGNYETAVTAVGALFIIILARWNGCGISVSKAKRILIASAVITVAYLVVRVVSGASNDFNSPSLPYDVSALSLILRAPYYTYAHFLLWVDPWGRGGVYIDDDPRGKLALGLFSWILLSALVAVLLYGLRSRFRNVAAGLLIFLGCLVPLSNYLALANGPICNYYVLFPALGLIIATVECLRMCWGWKRYKTLRGSLILGMCALFLAFGVETRTRVVAWGSEASLREFTLSNYPENYFQLTYAAYYLLKAGQVEEGKRNLEIAMEVAPWYSSAADMMANFYSSREMYAEGLEWLANYHGRLDEPPWNTRMREVELCLQLGDVERAYQLAMELKSREMSDTEIGRLYLYGIIPCLVALGETEFAQNLLLRMEASDLPSQQLIDRRARLLQLLEQD